MKALVFGGVVDDNGVMLGRRWKSVLSKPGFLIFILTVFFVITAFFFKNVLFPKPNEADFLVQGDKEEIRIVAREISERCRNEQAECWEEGVGRDLLDKYKLLAVFDAIYDWDVHFSCHAFTHYIGRAVYKKNGNIPDSYALVNYTCHGGAFHGVMEAFLDERKQTIDELDGVKIDEICKSSKSLIKKEPDMIYYECFHGFGHAFMFVTNANLTFSLKYCDRMIGESFREACYGGSLMENSTSSTNKDHRSEWLKEDEKFYPCTILGEKYLNQCYFYQANYLLMKTNRDFKQTFEDCYSLPDPVFTDYCILGIGAQLASVSNEQGMDRASGVCPIAQGDARNICIEGAVPSIFDRYGGNPAKPIEFCALTAVDLRGFCFGKVGSVAVRWNGDLDKICKSVQNYVDDCFGKKGQVFKY